MEVGPKVENFDPIPLTGSDGPKYNKFCEGFLVVTFKVIKYNESQIKIKTILIFEKS